MAEEGAAPIVELDLADHDATTAEKQRIDDMMVAETLSAFEKSLHSDDEADEDLGEQEQMCAEQQHVSFFAFFSDKKGGRINL